ncbi:MAG TPA: DUF1648 domain-containing protein [Polyangiaceae bacterium]|jgi:uncharacterized membrane protein|nr:DUF1648 domain-containing protein [Polyangiaceae bacterium]
METEKKPYFADAVTVGVLVLTFAITAAVYVRLPDPMPTHFAVNGRPNGWMPRACGAWLVPSVNVGLAALLRFGSHVVPRDSRARLEASPVRALSMMTVVFLSGVHLLVLHAALSPARTLGSTVWILLGLFFMALGQILPRTRRNPFMGVRTAWTLTSDENWAQTHRTAGYAFTLGGAAVAVGGWLHAPGLAIAALTVTVLAPVLWSWRLARRDD